MTMNAYDYDLMPRAQKVVGWMFDTCVNFYYVPIDKFYHMFLNSTVSKKIAIGNSMVIEGCSGRELAYDLLTDNSYKDLKKPDYYPANRSQEYWLGWALTYYQWCKGISFSQITEDVDIDIYLNMYDKYHEMDIVQFVDSVDDIRQRAQTESRLKRLRCYANLSQRQLADMSGVPLRTIQQYEQRAKDINKANVDYMIRLSRALNCEISMLLEEF